MKTIIAVIVLALCSMQVSAHDIYTDVRGKDQRLCCGGADCTVTIYRERGSAYEFLTRENEWVQIPEDLITFIAIPGDDPDGDSHKAHLCYRHANDSDNEPQLRDRVFGSIFLYCAFIPPGGT